MSILKKEKQIPETNPDTAQAPVQAPDLSTLETQLAKENYNKRFRGMLQSTIFALITVAAVAILIATIWMPVLQIYGSSMTPGLNTGDIVVCRKTENISRGDVLAFYYNNKIQIKRVIAVAGDEVIIEDDGTVVVNNMVLREPYVQKLSFGENTDIKMTFLVPEGKVFVLGDNREEAVDSRNVGLGCVDPEQYVGKLLICVWPAGRFGLIR